MSFWSYHCNVCGPFCAEKLNIKFRLATENEHEETTGERNTIQLVLEGKMEPGGEQEAAPQSQCTVSSTGENQDSCSPEEIDLKSGPWCCKQITTLASAYMPRLLPACAWSRISEYGTTARPGPNWTSLVYTETRMAWTGFSSLILKNGVDL